jgi:hypothetical protein
MISVMKFTRTWSTELHHPECFGRASSKCRCSAKENLKEGDVFVLLDTAIVPDMLEGSCDHLILFGGGLNSIHLDRNSTFLTEVK